MADFWGSESAARGHGLEFSDDGIGEDGKGTMGVGDASAVELVGGGDFFSGVDENI